MASHREGDAPEHIDVPEANVGIIIGRGGATIQRLCKATGCQIEVPRSRQTDSEGNIRVGLTGTPHSRQLAIAAIGDAIAGGDPEDHAARCEGALVIQHDLNSFDREAWAAWRLVPTEHEFGVHVDMGRRALKVWTSGRGRYLSGAVAERAKAAVDTALAEAKKLDELILDAKIELEPENAKFDTSVNPLIYQHGLLVFANRPEDGRIPIKITGPTGPVADAIHLLEAKYVKGRFTASVLQAVGQLQGMSGSMALDFERDLRSLEQECKVKVKVGHAVIMISGTNQEIVLNARGTLREMLAFYFPEGFKLKREIRPNRTLFERLGADPGLRKLTAPAHSALAFDATEGSAWICGKDIAGIEKRVDEVIRVFFENYWEMELADYGAAMWLLGPKGTGDYMNRMQADSGARMKVDPVRCLVCAEGKPAQIKEAERLVKDALRRLENKKKAEEVNGIQVKARELQSEHPPHMQTVLQKLAMLEAKNTARKMKERRAEIAAWQAEILAEVRGQDANNGAAGSGAAPAPRERSRSRDRQG
eukprot:TRINITY_DN15595_c0_g2_i1.p1 TRINITY_DN15595_c0_g2~~TRINITY_DN15595_c0_g2_i1.p1  ORF type:complete len:535 (+),score=119.95 TRINITY_DN15595_c0_g2_i1:85-1689(+)